MRERDMVMLKLPNIERDSMSRDEWDALFDKLRLALMNDHGVPGRRAHRRARAIMIQHYGEQPPGPPGKVSIAVAAVKAYLRKDESMTWDWTKGAWKSLRGAAAAAFATIVVPALAMFAFEVASKFDESKELEAAGVPAWLAPLMAILIGAGISLLRNKINIKHPNNPMKRAGAAVRRKLKPAT